MKRFGVCLVALTLFCAGCSSVRISHEGGHTMADIANSGWFLFNVIPLASGNPAKPGNSFTCSLFSDTVTMSSNMQLLNYALEQENAVAAKDIVSYVTEENILFIVAKHKVLRTSAELVKAKPSLSTRKTSCISENQ